MSKARKIVFWATAPLGMLSILAVGWGILTLPVFVLVVLWVLPVWAFAPTLKVNERHSREQVAMLGTVFITTSLMITLLWIWPF